VSDSGSYSVTDLSGRHGDDVRSQGPRIAWIAVKAFSALAAAQKTAARLPDGSVIALIGNGNIQGIIARLRQDFPRHIWLQGVTTFAATLTSDNLLQIANADPEIYWGDSLGMVASPSRENDWQFLADLSWLHWQSNVTPFIARKWLVNCVVNTLCGVFRLARNGMLLSMPEQLAGIFSEAYRLMRAQWYPGVENLPQILMANSLRSYIVEVVERTSANENSMAVDCRYGRPTESWFLAGCAVGRDDYPLLKAYHGTLEPVARRPEFRAFAAGGHFFDRGFRSYWIRDCNSSGGNLWTSLFSDPLRVRVASRDLFGDAVCVCSSLGPVVRPLRPATDSSNVLGRFDPQLYRVWFGAQSYDAFSHASVRRNFCR
jgi:ketopantoate reductase